jgi:hypothetical protein
LPCSVSLHAERYAGAELRAAHAAEVARTAGCRDLELTTNLRRADAHAFYEALGLERTSYKFHQRL